MKILILILATISIAMSTHGQTRQIEGQTEGRRYLDALDIWKNEPVSAYVDVELNLYLVAGGPLSHPRGFLRSAQIPRLVRALEQGLEWSKKAKAEKLEASKKLVELWSHAGSIDQTGVELTFFSANQGSQTDIVLHVIDFENRYVQSELYLNPSQVEKLIAILNRAVPTWKELQENTEKAEDVLQ